MKILRIGDPHVTVSNLKDSKNLIDFIIKTAIEYKVIRIEFLGDLFHTHAVKRLEVENFWMGAFNSLSTLNIPIYALVGNHDKINLKGQEISINALNVFKKCSNILIIDTPMIPHSSTDSQQNLNIGYIPYIEDKESFIEAARRLYNDGAQELLIAHQTFTGAVYEGGFYDPNGIEPDLILQDQIISGHIHTSQQIGKCFYTGTPKWDIVSDANIAKGIWMFEHNEKGTVINKEFISTENIVTPITKYIINEGEETPELKENARNYLEFHGKTAWINKMKKKYKGIASIKGVPVDRKMLKLDKDKSLTLIEYLSQQFQPIKGVTKQEINNYLLNIS